MAKKKRKIKKIDDYHHGDLRNNLIEVALKFLKQNPSEALSLRGLASLAGVSQSAPYRHFKKRDELLAAISQQGFEIKFNFLYESFIKYQFQPEELFIQFGLSFFQMGLKNPQHYKLMMTSTICPSEEFPELMAAAGKTYALLKIMIETCQRSGTLGPGDPYHLALHCWSVVSGFTSLYAEGRLGWLGVDDTNSISALRILLSQLLDGLRLPLQIPAGGFSPFKSKASEIRLNMLKDAEHEIERAIQTSRVSP